MSQNEPKRPYIYQPFGRSDKERWAENRLYAIGGVSDVTTISGLTREESLAVLKALDDTHEAAKAEEKS